MDRVLELQNALSDARQEIADLRRDAEAFEESKQQLIAAVAEEIAAMADSRGMKTFGDEIRSKYSFCAKAPGRFPPQ